MKPAQSDPAKTKLQPPQKMSQLKWAKSARKNKQSGNSKNQTDRLKNQESSRNTYPACICSVEKEETHMVESSAEAPVQVQPRPFAASLPPSLKENKVVLTDSSW